MVLPAETMDVDMPIDDGGNIRKKTWLDDVIAMTTSALQGVAVGCIKKDVKQTAWTVALTF
eukprot:16435632-Heterocapsa_arctica.AAC.1